MILALILLLQPNLVFAEGATPARPTPAAPATPTPAPAAPAAAAPTISPDRMHEMLLQRALMGGSQSLQETGSRFLTEQKTNCRSAADKLAKAQADRNKFCGTMGSDKNAILEDDDGEGRFSNYSQCLDTIENCERAIRMPMNLAGVGGMSSAGSGPSVVVNPSCQFLMVGSCKDNMDRADKQADKVKSAQEKIEKNRTDLTEAQEKMQASQQEMQSSMQKIDRFIKDLPDILTAELKKMDLETENNVKKAQEAIREAQAQANKLMDDIGRADVEAQDLLTKENEKCINARDAAQKEASAEETRLRTSKTKTKSIANTVKVLRTLKNRPKLVFDQCMKGPLHVASINSILKRRDVAMNSLHNQLKLLSGRINDLNNNLDSAIVNVEDEKLRNVRKRRTDFERAKEDLAMLQGQQMSKNYMDQMKMQQQAQLGQQAEQELQMSQYQQQMYTQAADAARQAGDTCQSGQKSGRETMDEARSASVTVANAVSEANATCCLSMSQIMMEGALGASLYADQTQGGQQADPFRASAVDLNCAELRGQAQPPALPAGATEADKAAARASWQQRKRKCEYEQPGRFANRTRDCRQWGDLQREIDSDAEETPGDR